MRKTDNGNKANKLEFINNKLHTAIGGSNSPKNDLTIFWNFWVDLSFL